MVKLLTSISPHAATLAVLFDTSLHNNFFLPNKKGVKIWHNFQQIYFQTLVRFIGHGNVYFYKPLSTFLSRFLAEQQQWIPGKQFIGLKTIFSLQ